MMNLAEYRNRTACLADFLPWAALVAPGVVLNKDGSFQRTARFRGPDLDSATPAELVGTTARLNNVLRRLGSGWAIFVEAPRLPAQLYPHSTFPDAVSALVDLERQEPSRRPASISRVAITSPSSGCRRRRTPRAPKPGSTKAVRNRASILTNCCAASSTAPTACSSSSKASCPKSAWLDDPATLTYLHSTISTRQQRVRVPETPMHLDALLADQPLTGGLEPRLGDAHLRMLTVVGFPTAT